MFSPVRDTPSDHAVEESLIVHIACGTDSSTKTGRIESYPLSTGPTTTTTLLNL